MQLGEGYKAEGIFKSTGKESQLDKWILSRCAYAVQQCREGLDKFQFTEVRSDLRCNLSSYFSLRRLLIISGFTIFVMCI